MLPLVVLGSLWGVGLGMRFKVFILVPALFISSLFSVGVSIAAGATIAMTSVAVAATAVALQFGYLVGTMLHLILLRVSVGRTVRARTAH